jgi:AhpC/TSA family
VPEPYNYDTFRRHMMQQDMHFRGGPAPGQAAPDFDLPTLGGERFRLSQYRGQRPVLIEFGSIT